MANKDVTIRYASRERTEMGCDNILLWKIKPTKRVNTQKNEYVYWLGSVSDILYTHTKEVFEEIFGSNNCPDRGQCLELKIMR